MKREEKELLLKDLCARLPYGVKVLCNDVIGELEGIKYDGTVFVWKDSIHYGYYSLDNIKPYLRPMSSMTEEEKNEYDLLSRLDDEYSQPYDSVHLIDWLNAHYIDYRQLIEQGLALEAPKGMYNFE